MCMDYSMTCQCGKGSASFNFKDNIMPVEVLNRLYCPDCSGGVSFDHASMLKDNGWVIEYDLDVAGLMRKKLPHVDLTPAFLFDEGYCTWRGVYPTDHIDVAREREEIVKLARIDQRKYLEEIKTWSVNRMERLRQEGWRKAQ
ncbi:MAG: hypothetical protein OHK006_07630 [Thermodesulfovibrionales bacterium]